MDVVVEVLSLNVPAAIETMGVSGIIAWIFVTNVAIFVSLSLSLALPVPVPVPVPVAVALALAVAAPVDMALMSCAAAALLLPAADVDVADDKVVDDIDETPICSLFIFCGI